MEQLVARWAHNPKAVGSSPAPATESFGIYARAFFYVQIFDELLALKVWPLVNADSNLDCPRSLELDQESATGENLILNRLSEY